MRATSGAHYIALDHVRALAAFIVIAWHFIHGASGYPVPFEGAPRIIPLAIFDEGHTGVALFMCLSGFFLWLAQRQIPIGAAYAVWTGIGAAGTFAVGILYFNDPTSIARYLGVALIVAGVATLKLAN